MLSLVCVAFLWKFPAFNGSFIFLPAPPKLSLEFLLRFLYNEPVPLAGVMELVDVADSKSAGGDSVWVRVPPPAPSSETLDSSGFERSSVFLF